MNKNAPMVQEYILGAAAPHFYYPPGTRLIEEIWYDTDDDDEYDLNESFRDVVVSSEILDALMPTEGIRKARGHVGIGAPASTPRPPSGGPSPSRNDFTIVSVPHTPSKPATGNTRPRVYGAGVPEPEKNSLSYMGGAQVRRMAMQQGYAPQQASEMGDAAYYQMRAAEDKATRNRLGRAALAVGMMGAAGVAPELIPGTSKYDKAARIGLMLGVAGTAALAESGLPDGAIRSYVSKKIKGKHTSTTAAMSAHTDKMMRRYGGVAHTPERDLLEIAATKTPTAGGPRETVRNQRKNMAREHALKALDVPEDVRQLYTAMGSTPPSKGYITSAKTGRVLAHATGNSADYFVPFTMKQMYGRGKTARDSKGNYIPGSSIKGGLRGNDYVRSRSAGGMTAEDVRTALVFGARKAEVVSPNGAEWIKFTDKAQKASSLIPGKNLHISRIPKQYDAVKKAIRENEGLKAQFQDPRDQHNAAVAYLAWKNPKYVVGPTSSASKPMRGTRPEQTPYVPPGDVTSSATYGQLRHKINQSLKSTQLPETMTAYGRKDTKRRTARQKIAEQKQVKKGIDHARKLGAHGAVTALKVGKAEDKAQAKAIINSSRLYDPTTKKFLSTAERKARARTAAAAPQQQTAPPVNEKPWERAARERREREAAARARQGGGAPAAGGVAPRVATVATAATRQGREVLDTANGVQRRADDITAVQQLAIQRMMDMGDAKLEGLTVDQFADKVTRSATDMLRNPAKDSGRVERRITEAEQTVIRSAAAKHLAEHRQRKEEEVASAGNPSGLTGSIKGIPKAEIEKKTHDLAEEMIMGVGGHPDFDISTVEGKQDFIAYAAHKIGRIVPSKDTKDDLNRMLNQVARSTRRFNREADENPDDLEVSGARTRYITKEAEATANASGLGVESYRDARRAYARAMDEDEFDVTTDYE